MAVDTCKARYRSRPPPSIPSLKGSEVIPGSLLDIGWRRLLRVCHFIHAFPTCAILPSLPSTGGFGERTGAGREGMPVGLPRNVRARWPEAEEDVDPQGEPCLIRLRQPASPRVSRGYRGGHCLTEPDTSSREHPGFARMRASIIHLSSEASHPSGPSGQVKRSADEVRKTSAAPSQHPGKPPARTACGVLGASFISLVMADLVRASTP